MKTLKKQELKERIEEVLRMLEEEGETIEVTDDGEVIAHLVPTLRLQQYTQKKETSRAWSDLRELAHEIGKHWQNDVSAVDAVRDVRREL
ncbi:MAG: hypothetical protein JO125_11300 [Chloroflexi bacterium]|nr:hypothetical protein [Chloroflexota bacterium]